MIAAERPNNRLLVSLPDDAYERIAPHLEQMSLKRGHVLHRPGQDIKDLYFPLDCLISVTVTMRDGRTAETGVVGRREVVGINAFMGGRETTQTEYVIQVDGDAVRVPADPLLEEFNVNAPLRSVLLRYTQAMFAQVTQNAACNGLHNMEQRLARWLLEVRDRIGSDQLRLSHEFISEMLGVRRAGITELSNSFEERGLIAQTRGLTRILNGDGLQLASCECYRVIRDEYDRLLREPGGSATRAPAVGTPPTASPRKGGLVGKSSRKRPARNSR
jgi:CRP-like cAMP-binding protein